jgi:hypothetical protein
VKTYAYFEVIKILDDNSPYLSLLGINWDFDNNVVLNLNQQWMSFEKKRLQSH